MNTFVNSIRKTSKVARTDNGALTHDSSGNAVVDFFHLAGASRGKNIIAQFVSAKNENTEYALRTALWARDVRQGAGERQLFRDILLYLEKNDFDGLMKVLPRVRDLGRWDDLLVLETEKGRTAAYTLIAEGLAKGDGLCAKWMPRKGDDAVRLRNFLGYTPKRYRKTLVTLTKVVETPMCANNWKDIVYDHVPSQAAKRYRKAFYKHDAEGYAAYVAELTKPVVAGQKPTRKINAGAIYPHDVIRDIMNRYGNASGVMADSAMAQWAALPDFVGEGSFLPMIDVSGSMSSQVAPGVTAMAVSLSLGLYTAERNKSAFKDTFLTFSANPRLVKVDGNLVNRVKQVFSTDESPSNTDLEKAFKAILDHAIKNNVPQEDMPQTLIIFSDMEFDAATRGTYGEKTLHNTARSLYADAGYDMPNIVYWNLNGRAGNSPVKYNSTGTALVSGFSPSTMTNVLSAQKITPLDVVLKTIMSERYSLAS